MAGRPPEAPPPPKASRPPPSLRPGRIGRRLRARDMRTEVVHRLSSVDSVRGGAIICPVATVAKPRRVGRPGTAPAAVLSCREHFDSGETGAPMIAGPATF